MLTAYLLAFVCLAWSTVAAEDAHNDEKRTPLMNAAYPPRYSNWLSSRPLRMLSPENELGYLWQILDKRSGETDVDAAAAASRDIRSPLGTMRFGKRQSPLGTMRFGKRSNPLSTMRFGKRAQAPLGTMRFGKRGVLIDAEDALVEE